MDTDVVEKLGTGQPFGTDLRVGVEMPTGTVESTIDEVDHLLDDVEAALTRLDEGTYGTCGSCGTAIDDHLLSVDPTVRNCAACEGAEPVESVEGEVLDEVADGRDDAETEASDAGADAWSEDEPAEN